MFKECWMTEHCLRCIIENPESCFYCLVWRAPLVDFGNSQTVRNDDRMWNNIYEHDLNHIRPLYYTFSTRWATKMWNWTIARVSTERPRVYIIIKGIPPQSCLRLAGLKWNRKQAPRDAFLPRITPSPLPLSLTSSRRLLLPVLSSISIFGGNKKILVVMGSMRKSTRYPRIKDPGLAWGRGRQGKSCREYVMPEASCFACLPLTYRFLVEALSAPLAP